MSVDSQLTWTDPDYLATVTGVLAVAAVVFYTAFTPSGPTTDEALFVLLAVALPVTAVRQLARRLG
ncbi:MAG: hypothetical protein J07HB67_01668 [halophilic archaeon J07HB67]|jgi:hypothetical protein|nr:MAG: hypothetical protein J07HB67_01668 [halophilic archaeon J07HB67]